MTCGAGKKTGARCASVVVGKPIAPLRLIFSMREAANLGLRKKCRACRCSGDLADYALAAGRESCTHRNHVTRERGERERPSVRLSSARSMHHERGGSCTPAAGSAGQSLSEAHRHADDSLFFAWCGRCSLTRRAHMSSRSIQFGREVDQHETVVLKIAEAEVGDIHLV